MNDMIIRASFLKRVTKDPERGLRFAQKFNLVKRQRPCYDHITGQTQMTITLHFEKNI